MYRICKNTENYHKLINNLTRYRFLDELLMRTLKIVSNTMKQNSSSHSQMVCGFPLSDIYTHNNNSRRGKAVITTTSKAQSILVY